MPKMVEVVIESIRAAFMGQQRLVLLRQVDDERFLAIVIDPYIAEQIAFGLQDLEIERPMSHDLLNQTIEQLRGKILRVEVVELKNQIYYGNIVIETPSGETLNIDSRSSDALALAVRSKVPILVAQKIMDEAGIEPQEENFEEDLEDLDSEPPSEEHLSIFQDFIENLDIDPDELDTTSEEDEQ